MRLIPGNTISPTAKLLTNGPIKPPLSFLRRLSSPTLYIFESFVRCAFIFGRLPRIRNSKVMQLVSGFQVARGGEDRRGAAPVDNPLRLRPALGADHPRSWNLRLARPRAVFWRRGRHLCQRGHRLFRAGDWRGALLAAPSFLFAIRPGRSSRTESRGRRLLLPRRPGETDM